MWDVFVWRATGCSAATGFILLKLSADLMAGRDMCQGLMLFANVISILFPVHPC